MNRKALALDVYTFLTQGYDFKKFLPWKNYFIQSRHPFPLSHMILQEQVGDEIVLLHHRTLLCVNKMKSLSGDNQLT